jgi:hypothetical protein
LGLPEGWRDCAYFYHELTMWVLIDCDADPAESCSAPTIPIDSAQSRPCDLQQRLSWELHTCGIPFIRGGLFIMRFCVELLFQTPPLHFEAYTGQNWIGPDKKWDCSGLIFTRLTSLVLADCDANQAEPCSAWTGRRPVPTRSLLGLGSEFHFVARFGQEWR